MNDDLKRTNPPLPRGADNTPRREAGVGERRDVDNSPRREAGVRPKAGAISALLIFLVRLYQLTLSRFLGGQCRFVPTCSQYFIEAVRVRGPLVGSLLGLWRVLRCNPFSKGGYDPVE